MEIQQAIVRQLARSSSATYAALGNAARIYWAVAFKNQVVPFVMVRKAARRALTKAMNAGTREPSDTTIEVVSVAKTQEQAATIAGAVTDDLLASAGSLPLESPLPGGTVYVHAIYPLTEEDLMSDDILELGLFAEMRSYQVLTRAS